MSRMTQPLLRLLAAVLLAVAVTGCESELDSLISPTPPIPDPTTVVVAGSITPNGAWTHAFQSNSFGTVQATLLSLEPDPEAVVGLALGTWNGAACQLIIADDRATQGTIVLGNVTSVGSLCIRVSDAAGTLPGSVSFDVQIVHP